MSTEFFYTRGGQRFGPVSGEELKKKAVSGDLSPSDLIWREGMENWAQAVRVKGLFPAVPAQPPELPLPAVPAAKPTGAVSEAGPQAADTKPPQIDPSEAARLIAGHARAAAIAAGGDAIKAFMAMVRNPVGGLREACDYLGPRRAMNAGILFAVIFDVFFVLGVRLFVGVVARAASAAGAISDASTVELLGSSSLRIGFGAYAKLAALGLVPILSAIAGFAGMRTFFHGKGSLQVDVFLAGASLLPCAIGALFIGVLGLNDAEVFPAIIIFSLTTTVLMTFSGCTKVQGSADSAATFAVPLMLLVDVYACDFYLKHFF
jgi:hypothetical protein